MLKRLADPAVILRLNELRREAQRQRKPLLPTRCSRRDRRGLRPGGGRVRRRARASPNTRSVAVQMVHHIGFGFLNEDKYAGELAGVRRGVEQGGQKNVPIRDSTISCRLNS